MTESVVEKLISVHDTKQHERTSPPVSSPPFPSSSSSYSTSTILFLTVLGIIIFGVVAFSVSSLKLVSLLSSSHPTPGAAAAAAPTSAAAATTATTPNITHPAHVHIDHHTHHLMQQHHINKPSIMEPVSFQVRELEGTIMIEPEQATASSSSDELDVSQMTNDYDISQAPHTTDVGAGYGAMADMSQLQAQAQQYRQMYPTNENMPEEYRYQNPNYAPQQAIDPNPVYGVFGPQPPPAAAAPQQAQAPYQQPAQAQPYQQQAQPYEPQAQTRSMTRPQMIQPQPLPPGRAQTVPVYRVATSPQQARASYLPNPPAFPSPPR